MKPYANAFLFIISIIYCGCSATKPYANSSPESVPQNRDGNIQWIKVLDHNSTQKTPPAAGEDMAIAFDTQENRLILFGGKTDTDSTVSETWIYYPTRNQWEQLQTSAKNPPPREDHILIYDSHRHKAIMHGGEDGDTSNELWELDLTSLQWESKSDSLVPPLEDHTAEYVTFQKCAYFFGGQNEERPILNDIWKLNLDPESPEFYQWSKIEPIAESKRPKARIYHEMAYDEDRNRLLIFGGWDKIEDEFTTDTWAFYFETNTWKKIKHKKKKGKFSPSPRRHMTAALDKRRNLWIIFGGDGEGGPLNDTWAFDLTNDTWKNLTPGPPPRRDHSMLYDANSGEIYMYGGDLSTKKSTEKLHDLWKLNLPDEAESPEL